MGNTDRIDKTLFEEDHYLGKPADGEDKIVHRRIAILYKQPDFFGKTLDCIEIGCGSGATINRVAKDFHRCLGVDVFDYSKDFEKEKTKWQATNSEFRQINLEEVTPSERFDRIISFEVIEHFRTDDTVSKYNELLKPGGLAALSVPNKWWIFETHGARLPLLPWNRVPFFSWLPRSLHERWANARIYTPTRIQQLLKKHGFEIVNWSYITAPMDVLKEGRLKKFLTKNFFKNDTTTNPFLATAIFILARKTSEKK